MAIEGCTARKLDSSRYKRCADFRECSLTECKQQVQEVRGLPGVQPHGVHFP